MTIASVSQQDRDFPCGTGISSRVPVAERRAISVRGIVQGVGFRPFIYALASCHGLSGWVRNDSQGVEIEVEGPAEDLDLFLAAVSRETPPLALVEAISWRSVPTLGEQGFRIEESQAGSARRALISPDVATCDACLHELFDPADRRYRYPFINCTNCGPRLTITRSVPYDRPQTTMAGFVMCPVCREEYEDPGNRRFHAQPNACPECGPQVALTDAMGTEIPAVDPICQTAELLLNGAIVAIKGMGGYHLACNPFDAGAVERLRRRKVRQDKPFALMARDVAQARSLCRISSEEVAILISPARPIVLLARLPYNAVTEMVAPGQNNLGVMLAYTPLHHVLLHDCGIPLVMTSGNRSDEPIASRDEEALEQLGGIADYFLVHNRPIHIRCDDSVTRLVEGRPYPMRRSRGYAPTPLTLGEELGSHILACGGELKNTFCLGKENHVFLSHHIGDLENYETLRSFHEGVEHYSRLFDVQPEMIAYDLHPEYLSTKYALDLIEAGVPGVGIQHHHAHIASCLADNMRPGGDRVIGVALDGTGYGTDGAIWGGEFLTGSIADGFERRAHLQYVPMPGGSAAIRQPWRMAVTWLLSLYGESEVCNLPLPVLQRAGKEKIHLTAQMLAAGINTPLTSSAGRLFDAVAALLDVPAAMQTTYEGQAAIELEMLAAGEAEEGYSFGLRETADGWVVETGRVVGAVVADLLASRQAGEIADRFHRTMAEMVAEVCERLRAEGEPDIVALSGGTFQNMLLLHGTMKLLRNRGFTVYIHSRVPANDGGLALGQAVLADAVIRRSREERHG